MEEAKSADLILNVADASSPDLKEQLDVTLKVLSDIGASEISRITVLNKCDKVEEIPHLSDETVVRISALKNEGIDDLIMAVGSALAPTHTRLKAVIPYSEGNLISLILQNGKIYSQEYVNEGTLIDAFVDNKILYKIQKYCGGKNE